KSRCASYAGEPWVSFRRESAEPVRLIVEVLSVGCPGLLSGQDLVIERSSRQPATAEEPIVFVVDDDESMREALRSLFRSVSLRVETFGSAADFLRSKLPDVASCLV